MRITMTDWIHRVLDEYIKEGDCCIDATMGKGGDTYYLCSKTGESGKVYAFDVQADALRQTREKLDKHKTNLTVWPLPTGLYLSALRPLGYTLFCSHM